MRMPRVRFTVRWLMVALGVLTLAVCTAVVARSLLSLAGPKARGIGAMARMAIRFPEDREVLRVTASLSGQQLATPPVPEFSVPGDLVPRLLAAFRPGERITLSREWDAVSLGELRIWTRDGGSLRILFGDTSKRPLLYKLDGVAYSRGGRFEPVSVMEEEEYWTSEGAVMFGLLRALSEGRVSEARACFETLERSAGRPLAPDVHGPE